MMNKRIRVKAPATISNLNCGFDVLGLAIEEPYDIIELELTHSGIIEITDIKGCKGLSRDPGQNVIGAVLKAVMQRCGDDTGFRAILEKGINPGSGIGSSGASAAAAAYAANVLLGNRFSETETVEFAMEGERLVSGSAHADNVAPAVLGGIVLVRSYEPLEIVRLNIPSELFCVVVHPEMELKTSDSRRVLGDTLPLKTAVKQWGNVGGLIAGLYAEDYELISHSLVDYVAEPKRSVLIPGFAGLKGAALDGGALGAGISGSGPSVFALCRGRVPAAKVLDKMKEYMMTSDTAFNAYMSPVNRKGAVEC